MRTTVMSGIMFVVACSMLSEQIATAQEPLPADIVVAEQPIDAIQIETLSPHAYPCKRCFPPVSVTEIYRGGRCGTSRDLNVFIHGMRPDVYRLLHCYQPCGSCRHGGHHACAGHGCHEHLQHAIPIPIDPDRSTLPAPPLGVDADPVAPDPFKDDLRQRLAS